MKQVAVLVKETREAQNFSLKQISQETRISLDQLKNIESGDWTVFSSYTYLQGAVGKLAQYLNLDTAKILAMLKREIKEEKIEFIRVTDYQKEQKPISANLYFYFFIFILILVFLLRLISFWQKPVITVADFSRTIALEDPLIIKGSANPGVLIFINDERIFQDDQGKFMKKLYFKKGKHSLVIKAIGTNGKEEIKEYEIVVR